MPNLKLGLKVKFRKQSGKITSTYYPYLRIRLDNDKRLRLVHPKDDDLEILYS
ncbi:MAG: hypothetical protein IPJ03_16085 [Ignavibacteriales bacterium]|nr:hypothetical protein [Ignavibacteriales bacterium]